MSEGHLKPLLTGSRIRARRMSAGLRQGDLATRAGISPSYLNLIEHNRRRIAGKLLLDIAALLEVDPQSLAEGAESETLARLQEFGAASAVEVERAEEFAGRFPGWAEASIAAGRRIAELEHRVASLSDRMAHDVELAASLHEVITKVTAIRSTAAILAETETLEPEWQARFQRNLNEDASSLAIGAESLVQYLEGDKEETVSRLSPNEEVEAFFAAEGYYFAALETVDASPKELVANRSELTSEAARDVAVGMLTRYREDARAMPLSSLAGLSDPAEVAQHCRVDLASAMRRLACLPPDETRPEMGLVIADASGTLTFRKPISGFALPRFGTACPLWPLFQALSTPMQPISAPLLMAGRGEGRFQTYAVAQPVGAQTFGQPTRIVAHMLIMRDDGPEQGHRPVGTSCRICPHQGCEARRETSVI